MSIYFTIGSFSTLLFISNASLSLQTPSSLGFMLMTPKWSSSPLIVIQSRIEEGRAESLLLSISSIHSSSVSRYSPFHKSGKETKTYIVDVYG